MQNLFYIPKFLTVFSVLPVGPEYEIKMKLNTSGYLYSNNGLINSLNVKFGFP